MIIIIDQYGSSIEWKGSGKYLTERSRQLRHHWTKTEDNTVETELYVVSEYKNKPKKFKRKKV